MQQSTRSTVHVCRRDSQRQLGISTTLYGISSRMLIRFQLLLGKISNISRTLVDRICWHQQVKESTSRFLPRLRCGKRPAIFWFGFGGCSTSINLPSDELLDQGQAVALSQQSDVLESYNVAKFLVIRPRFALSPTITLKLPKISVTF